MLSGPHLNKDIRVRGIFQEKVTIIDAIHADVPIQDGYFTANVEEMKDDFFTKNVQGNCI